MTAPILDSVFNFDNRAQRWRDSVTGRFVSNQAVQAEMYHQQQATFSTLEGLTQQLYQGNISLANWQVAVASELKDAHLAQSMFAVGGRSNMGFAEFGRLCQTLREQYGFLANFADEIAAGTISEAQALNRIKMYGEACQQSYWAEYALDSKGLIDWNLNPAEHCGGCVANAAGGPYTAETLPNYPGDGATPCKGRCHCTLSRRGESNN